MVTVSHIGKLCAVLAMSASLFGYDSAHGDAADSDAMVPPCQPQLLAEASPGDVDGYRLRDGVCEGRFAVQVSSPGGLRLASLTYGAVDWKRFDGAASVVLRWRSTAGGGVIHVTGTPIPPSGFEMDTQVTGKTTFSYDLRLVRRFVKPLRMGFVATIPPATRTQDTWILPLSVGNPTTDALHLTLIAPRDVIEVRVTVTAIGTASANTSIVTDAPVRGGPWAEDDAIEAEVPGIHAGRYAIEIAAVPDSGLPMPRQRLFVDAR